MKEIPFYAQLSEAENNMLKNILKKYGFHSKAEFIRYIIKELYTKEKIELTPINIQPFGLD